MTENLSRKTAVELASLIATKAVSPVEVLDAHLATIARVNPGLNAIVTLVADGARVLAQQAEAAVMRGDKLGSLHGLPVAIKDVTPTAGIRTTYGSPLFKDNVPTEDAEAVRRLKAAGAIVLGKTNTPEFAAGANTFNDVFGVTRNPWNPALSPAGSSGGSAVAVATMSTRLSGSSTQSTGTSWMRRPLRSASTRSSVSKNHPVSDTRGSSWRATSVRTALNPHCASENRAPSTPRSSRL